jgi:hypothetical protein
MSIKVFRSACDAQPFIPFSIRLADGRSIPVRHREFATLSPTGRTVLVWQADGSYNMIDLLLVTDLVVGASDAPKGSPADFGE